MMQSSPQMPASSQAASQSAGQQSSDSVTKQAVATPSQTVDRVREQRLLSRLTAVFHAWICLKHENKSCILPHCKNLKTILQHMSHCSAGKSCSFPDCTASREIISHWENYDWCTCYICAPKKKTSGTEAKQKECSESLSNDLGQLFGNKKYSDVILKCGDDSFSVHRNILAARSSVFSAMFDHDMAEKNSGIVTIEDMESSILKQFLQYLYTGNIEDITIESAIDLFVAADKYAVECLKKLCSYYMLNNVSKESVCRILLVADLIRDDKLLEGVVTFAAQNNEFLNTDEWRDFAFKHSNVAIKVCLKFMDNSFKSKKK